MGDRDRQYYDRDDNRFDNRDNRDDRDQRARDWGSRDDRHYYSNTRNQDDRNYSSGRNQDDRSYYGSRNQDDRNYSSSRNQDDYGARYTGSEGRRYQGATDYTGYSNAGSFGSGDRNRDWDRGRRNDYGQNDYEGRYNTSSWDRDRNSSYGGSSRPFGFDRSYARSSLGGYGEGLYEGSEWSRLPTQERYSQRDWVDRAYGRGYGGEGFRGAYGGEGYRGSYGQEGYGGYRGDRDESWTQQLRDAGQQVVRRVKRAFRGPKGYKRSDERIREDVSDRLAQQDRIDPSEIEVTVSNGDVTLTGTVQSRHEKFLAEELADDVSGVNEVHNNLRVRREQSTQSTLSGTGTTTNDSTIGNQNAADAARNRRTA